MITNNRKKSGAARITCKYYEELNRILGTKPNVDPHDLVGNVDNDLNDYNDDATVPEAEAIAEKSIVEQPKKKRKYTSSVETSTQNLMSWMDDWAKKEEKKEEERERRQENRLERLEALAQEKNDILRDILVELRNNN